MTIISSQWGSQKVLHGLFCHELTAYLSVFDLFLTRWILAILWKGRKPEIFKSHNSLKLSFANIWNLHSNFTFKFCWMRIFPWTKLSLHSSSMWDELGWLNWFWQFLKSFIPNGFSYKYEWTSSLFEGRPFFCMGLIFRELCRFLLMFLIGFTSLSVILLFPLSITFFIFMHGFWFYFI